MDTSQPPRRAMADLAALLSQQQQWPDWQTPRVPGRPHIVTITLQLSGQRDIMLSQEFVVDLLLPYLNALADLQHIIDILQGRPLSEMRVHSIRVGTVTVGLSGVADVLKLMLDVIDPTRRRIAKERAILQLERERAEIQARNAETELIKAQTEQIRQQQLYVSREHKRKLQLMDMQMDRERLAVTSAWINCAFTILAKLPQDFSAEQKEQAVHKLLPPLKTLGESPLELIKAR